MKVYDSDFCDTETSDYLVSLATDLAREYRGNWDAMCAVKHFVLTGGALDQREARRTLNMLLSCVEAEANGTVAVVRDALDGRTPYVFRATDGRKRRANVPKLVQRRASIPVKVTIHARYGRPRRHNAKVHVIDHGLSCADWKATHLPFGGIDYDNRVFSLRLVWLCGKSCVVRSIKHRDGGYSYGSDVELWKGYHAVTFGYSFCAKCQQWDEDDE